MIYNLLTGQTQPEFITMDTDTAGNTIGRTVINTISTVPVISEWKSIPAMLYSNELVFSNAGYYTIKEESKVEKKEETKEEAIARKEAEFLKRVNITEEILDVIYSGCKTIVLWKDGSKTIVSTGVEDSFDPQVGLSMAVTQKLFGSRNQFLKLVNKSMEKVMTRKASRKEKMEYFYVWLDTEDEKDWENANHLVYANKASDAAEKVAGTLQYFGKVFVISKEFVKKNENKKNILLVEWITKHKTTFTF